MMRRGITAAEREEMRRMAESGVRVSVIAREIDRAQSTVSRILAADGVRPMKAFSRLTPAQVKRMLAMYKAGAEIKEITADLGVTSGAIYHHLHRQEVPLRTSAADERQPSAATRPTPQRRRYHGTEKENACSWCELLLDVVGDGGDGLCVLCKSEGRQP